MDTPVLADQAGTLGVERPAGHEMLRRVGVVARPQAVFEEERVGRWHSVPIELHPESGGLRHDEMAVGDHRGTVLSLDPGRPADPVGVERGPLPGAIGTGSPTTRTRTERPASRSPPRSRAAGSGSAAARAPPPGVSLISFTSRRISASP